MSLRDTECRGNLGGTAGEEDFVSPHLPPTEIASSLALLAKTVEVGRDCFAMLAMTVWISGIASSLTFFAKTKGLSPSRR